MLYDCFTFFNELDLLEIRLNYLNEVVDKFVLVEMDKTHSNEKKPLFFDENKDRYKEFLDKIIHIKVTDYPDELNQPEVNSWFLENYQRDCIMRGLENAKNDDIVMISDLDEIPSLEAIKNYKSGVAVLEQRMMYYYLNNQNVVNPIWTLGTKIANLSEMKNPDQNVVLGFGCPYTKRGMPTYLRFYRGPAVKNGGWHFSYLGGSKVISYKIKSFAHQELNRSEFTSEDKIAARVMLGYDLFDRGDMYKAVPLDASFPKYILDNKEKYKEHIREV